MGFKEDLISFGSDVFKSLPWKELAYKAMTDTIIPLMEAKAKDTNSMVDDVMVNGLKQAVEVFLSPQKALP